MTRSRPTKLLNADEGASFEISNPEGTSPVLLVCEHASKRIPASLENLELDDKTANSHVAWDPGALSVSLKLSKFLDATLISARFSRLVYDCNRPPEAEGAMPSKSEVFLIPGNRNLTEANKNARVDEIYNPFKQAITDKVADRKSADRPTVLVTIHSFTSIYFGETRKVELGILHDSDSTLADTILNGNADLKMRRNQPYGPEDGVTHTLKLHALPNGLLNVMIEIRNDLIVTTKEQKNMAAELSRMLNSALDRLHIPTSKPEASHA